MSKALKDIEIECLLESIYQHYGYDFRSYAKASLKRRIQNFVSSTNCTHVSELIPKLLHNRELFGEFLSNMSVTVTEMFRDPEIFKTLREKVIPVLKTYSRINIWHAGCATGEEVYSMAILLHEEGLLERTRIYATDFNEHSLATAEAGIYPAERMQLYTQNYLKAGGKHSLADYYWANYNSAKMSDFLRDRITFANHNLSCDQVFAEMHLTLCRNVLIYFDKDLQNRVLNLFSEGLTSRGFLSLGDKETLKFSSIYNDFEAISEPLKIYRKKRYV